MIEEGRIMQIVNDKKENETLQCCQHLLWNATPLVEELYYKCLLLCQTIAKAAFVLQTISCIVMISTNKVIFLTVVVFVIPNF